MEEAVICALLQQENRMAEVAPLLCAEMFENPDLGFIYQALASLYERGEQPDLITTYTEMRRLDEKRALAMNGLRDILKGLGRIRHDGNLLVYVRHVRRNASLRRIRSICAHTELKASEASADPLTLIARTEQALLELRQMEQVGGALRQAGEIASDTLQYHCERMDDANKAQCVMSGLVEFDRITGGMHAGELYVGAGRPGDGKSAVALQIAINAAQQGKRVCFFSLEMNEMQIMNRFFTGYAGVTASHLRYEGIRDDELERMKRLTQGWSKLPFYLDYTPANTVGDIRSQVLLLKKREGCDLVIVDYLHLLGGVRERNETMEQVIARHVRGLKALALEADCPILLISQMNRNNEVRGDKAHLPVLSDLRDSGTIEQVADCVFFVYRPDRYGITSDPNTGEDLKNIAKLLIAKNRNGNTGAARFMFNETFTRLSNPENKLAL